MNINQFICVFK